MVMWSRPAVDLAGDAGRAGAGVEGEVEALEGERAVHRRDAGQADGGGGPEEGHLQAAVLPDLVPVLGGQGLAHREADLVAAVVDALPLGGGAVVGQVRGQRHRDREVGLAEEEPHLDHPGRDRQDGEGAGETAGEGTGEPQRSSLRPSRLIG